MKLLAGTYSINAGALGGSAGDSVYVPADKTNEEDFGDSGLTPSGMSGSGSSWCRVSVWSSLQQLGDEGSQLPHEIDYRGRPRGRSFKGVKGFADPAWVGTGFVQFLL